MATEKLIALSEVKKKLTAVRQYFSGYPSTEQDKLARSVVKLCMEEVGKIKPVDAVEVEKYNALLEMYHTLRENFVDYYCSGIPNVAPYCLNMCEDCITPHGWCKAMSDKCRGFNPAEVILDGERKDNERKAD